MLEVKPGTESWRQLFPSSFGPVETGNWEKGKRKENFIWQVNELGYFCPIWERQSYILFWILAACSAEVLHVIFLNIKQMKSRTWTNFSCELRGRERSERTRLSRCCYSCYRDLTLQTLCSSSAVSPDHLSSPGGEETTEWVTSAFFSHLPTVFIGF